jgi:hypothetical protein
LSHARYLKLLILEGEKMKKSFLIITATLLLFCCSNVQRDWEKTRSLNTNDAYEAFLIKHPNSEFSSEARSILENREIAERKEQEKRELEKIKDQQAWEQATEDNTYFAYKDYIARYPRGLHSAAAKSKLKKLIYWIETNVVNTTANKNSLSQYAKLNRFSIGDGRHDIERVIGKSDTKESLPSSQNRFLYHKRSFWTSLEKAGGSYSIDEMIQGNQKLRTLILLFDTNDILLHIDIN